MSSERSNSAVRNLRSIFENKASENSPSARGRSPGSLASDFDTPHRPTSKVRASFIPVEPTMAALAAEQDAAENELSRQTSTEKRRQSFSDSQSGEATKEMKDTVGAEQERRDQESTVAETIPETAVESAAPTPAIEALKELGSAAPKAQKEDKEAANPDKPVTGAEEEPVDMKPADPASESAVSGGEALPPGAEDLRKTAPKSTKPGSISTKPAKAATSSVKSPSLPKTPVSTSSAAPAKKPSRSSLTAPTAASVARQAAADKQAAASSKPKPREVTKPLEVSSRLTAPTAATRARLESATAAPSKPAVAPKAKATTSVRPTPRQSLAGRPESRSSQKPVAPVDGSFLERMTRPTAASSNRAHEKTEVKSPSRQKQLPIRPKPNGVSKAKTSASAAAAPAAEDDVTAIEDASILPEDDQGHAETAVEAEPAEPTAVPEKAPEPAPADTPVSNSNGNEEQAATLESTPAAMGDEQAIR